MDNSDSKDKELLDSMVYNYATHIPQLEEENRLLKETVESLRVELEKFKKPPLIVCEVYDILDKHAVVRLQNGNEFLVEVAHECPPVRTGDTVLAEQKNLTVVRKIQNTKKFNVEKFVIIDNPKVQWSEVGGLRRQVEEIKEGVELPLRGTLDSGY